MNSAAFNTDRHIAIVGGAGFLGLSLAEYLLARVPHAPLLILDAKCPRNWLERHPTVRFDEIDVTERSTLQGKFNGVAVVFHKAGILGGPRSASLDTALEYLRINAVGAYNVLEAAQVAGVHKVIFDSTEQIFGPCDEPRARDEWEPAWPLNYYGVSKTLAENICRVFGHEGMTVVICRYPRVRSSMSQDVISTVIRKVLAGEAIVLKNRGEKTFGFVDIEDVCRASELLLTRVVPSGVLHIGSGECVSLIDLVGLVENITGTRATVLFEPDTSIPFDADHSLLNVRFARDLLGYQPSISVREMIDRSFRWIAAQEGFQSRAVRSSA